MRGKKFNTLKTSYQETIKNLEKQLAEKEQEVKDLNKELNYDSKFTFIYNMRWFKKNFNDSNEIFIALADINNLKAYNDEFGHPAGDRLIGSVCKKLQMYGDVVKFGGDEFLVILHDENAYTNLMELKDSRFEIGFCEKTKYMLLKEALGIADKNLYEKKYNRTNSAVNLSFDRYPDYEKNKI